MAPNEVSHVDVITATLALNHVDLEAQKVATVLQHELGDLHQQLTRLLGVDTETEHLIEDTAHVADLGGEHTT